MTPFEQLTASLIHSCSMRQFSEEESYTGYPVGNFGIGGEITPSGKILSRVIYNPPRLGSGLEELGYGQFTFSCGGTTLRDEEFESKDVYRLFPEASITFSDSRIPDVTISTSFFAPLKVRDAFPCSIPTICADIEFSNNSMEEKRITTEFEFKIDIEENDITPLINPAGFWLVGRSDMKIGFDGAISWKGVTGGIAVSSTRVVPPKGSAHLRFMLICHNTDGFYTSECPNIADLAAYISGNWNKIKSDLSEFVDLLPRTHDDQINRYLRWYLQAGILFTRITREHVLTMGYCELNQRDSFWTSWLHLVLWPDLERRMIEESAQFQRDNGKIPTTVLTVIDREDDIDINEYYNLRIVRYYEWTGDLEFVKQMWPSFKQSITYIKSCDKDSDGLLDQGSYWGDWKDVWGVEGRKAGPHFEFLWLAVLKQAAHLAKKLHDTEAAQQYTALYDRSYQVINSNIDEGGLWNGKFYTTLWYDGREDNHVQEDQAVGPLYGVVPQDRISSIYEALQPNMTDWGVRDTYPYREKFSHEGGDYHNGGIWPFLNFMDALSRFMTGYPNGGFEILKRVGEWDLEKWGDYLPAEFLDGNTGENAGKPIQAWNADYYAAVFFGILGVRMLSQNKVEIMPRIPDSTPFETAVLIPQGVIRLRQTPVENGLKVELRSELHTRIEVKYGAWTAKNARDCVEERIGECEFKVVELYLNPGQLQQVEMNL